MPSIYKRTHFTLQENNYIKILLSAGKCFFTKVSHHDTMMIIVVVMMVEVSPASSSSSPFSLLHPSPPPSLPSFLHLSHSPPLLTPFSLPSSFPFFLPPRPPPLPRPPLSRPPLPPPLLLPLFLCLQLQLTCVPRLSPCPKHFSPWNLVWKCLHDATLTISPCRHGLELRQNEEASPDGENKNNIRNNRV